MRIDWNPLTLALLVILAIGLFILFYPIPLRGQQPHDNPWLRTWIPSKCCVTSDYCFEIAASAVQSLPDDQWRIVASGQVLKRTDYSPDGRYYRCAGGWRENKNTINHTHCLFVPFNGT